MYNRKKRKEKGNGGSLFAKNEQNGVTDAKKGPPFAFRALISLPQSTKAAISEAFFRIAKTRPPEKITVRDIVVECGVTRNTFYYYFRDVYDVIEDAFLTIASGIGSKADPASRLSDMLGETATFLSEHRAAMKNIISSVGRSALQKNLSKAVDRVLFGVLQNEAEAYGNVSEDDLRLIAAVGREALLGVLLDWLESNEKTDPKTILSRLNELFDGVIPVLLGNAASQRKTTR